MKSEQEIREAQARFDTLARSASRASDAESYEVTANMAMALGWVLDMPGPSVAVRAFLKGTRTVAREDN